MGSWPIVKLSKPSLAWLRVRFPSSYPGTHDYPERHNQDEETQVSPAYWRDWLGKFLTTEARNLLNRSFLWVDLNKPVFLRTALHKSKHFPLSLTPLCLRSPPGPHHRVDDNNYLLNERIMKSHVNIICHVVSPHSPCRYIRGRENGDGGPGSL